MGNLIELVFYESSSGDTWALCKRGDGIAVQHQPNTASGGQAALYDLGAFLMKEPNAAQNVALRDLIATLMTAPGRDTTRSPSSFAA